jgi:transcriptional regulator with XRE-family HTH domain
VNTRQPLSQLLRQHRQAADLTLEALAERSGVSDRTISDIERGVSLGPQRRTMLALADALGLSADDHAALLAAARTGRRGVRDARPIDLEPHRLADFTGRSAEVNTVIAHLSETDGETAAPVLLCGAPGVGKTSIAVEALHRCSARTPTRLFVDLGGLDPVPLTPLQVLQSLLRQLTGEPDPPKSLGEAAVAWRTAVAGSPVAVLLDDAANEAQLRPVLAPGRQGVVVVTSRRDLAGLEGARRLTVGPLPRPEGVDLLERILPPEQARTGDLDELARLCDDIPLALRIAGNRLASQPAWTVEDLVRRLRVEERRLRALVAGDLAVESAFALSYQHLDEPSRSLFRRLSLLGGASFDERLASAVGDLGEADAQEVLDGLIGLGLVEALQGDRYRLHDLLRLYAASRLRSEEPPEAISAHRRSLREWLLTTTIAAGSRFEPRPSYAEPAPGNGLRFSSLEEARQWLVTESEHWYAAYRAAASRGDHTVVLAVADSLHWFSDLWLAWGRWHEVFTLSAASARALGDASQQAAHLGYLAWTQLVETFDPEAARTTARAALEAAQRADDPRQSGWAHFYLAWSSLDLRDLPAAAEAANSAAADFATAGDAEGQLQSRSIGAKIRSLTDPEAAIHEYHDLATFVRAARPELPRNIAVVTETNALCVIAKLLLEQGHYEQAITEATNALAAGDPGEFPTGQAAAHRHRGLAELALGHLVAARTDLTTALTLGTETRPAEWLEEVRTALRSLPD